MNNLSKFSSENYDTILKEDISEIIQFFLEDLEAYCIDNDVILSKKDIQRLIENFKERALPSNEPYYSEKDRYEEIILGTDYSEGEFIEELLN